MQATDRLAHRDPDFLEAQGVEWEWAQRKSARAILSAMGHPNYGEVFARKALADMRRYGLTSHEAVFGSIEAQRKVYLSERGER